MSAIKYRKRLAKFKITRALPKKFGSKGFITVVKSENETSIFLKQYFRDVIIVFIFKYIPDKGLY